MATKLTKTRGNLPEDTTSLVGRRTEATDIRDRMVSSRLVTLTGIGGAGKTRLAISVARGLRRSFDDGAWLVELAELTKPDLLTLTVMRALDIPANKQEPLEDLVAHLGDERRLIVLDNCEHLIDSCAKLVRELLRACPHLRILATSREPLRITGEVVYSVPPMSLPHIAEVKAGDEIRFDAVNLFVQRAIEAAPHFAISDANRSEVVELCTRLDGLPLAIELASVLMRSMSVHELLMRHRASYDILPQDDRAVADRHRTVRAAMDWSYDLCTEDERRLWADLSVFSGPIELAAIEAVCEPVSADHGNVVNALVGLVDKSIVSYDGTDYRMLETIRHYGAERLAEINMEQEVVARHRDHYLSVARYFESAWFGPEEIRLFEDMQRRHANLRVALESSLSQPSADREGLALASALWAFWIACGHPREGGRWLDQLLKANRDPYPERAPALWVKGYLLTVEGAPDQALVVLHECLNLAQEIGDPLSYAHATYICGLAELFRANVDEGTAYLQEGVALEAQAKGFNLHLTLAKLNLGIAAISGDRVDRALEILEECRIACAAHNEQWMMSWSQLYLGIARWLRGDQTKAEKTVIDALRYKQTLGDPLGVAMALNVLAWTAEANGDATKAAKFLGASRALWEPLGSHMAGFTRLQEWSAQCTARAESSLGSEAFTAAFSAGERKPDDAVEIALGHTHGAAAPQGKRQDVDHALTKREAQIASLVADGLTNREIADTLIVSVRTVEAHVEHVLRKLGFTSRAQIATFVTARNVDRSV
ncbi:LuxR C-terminal-related transcriptional regulator [Saccharopolyspora sp. ASAGF58]|uniref:ATP-binding protein n=1 Tax=Saccharopolyspora sp. ASAGF58 TaxID=2719023 RepID=UPI00143FE835|nr:LuxR C-terminal-related transcriptional regulator [Saccharopolyspora sp. ASAGF58]QIZ37971.1 LuxR family transcriptional regulator [Saccharopolyspora sp. ASAGF58]